ncbi:MAG: hypothetical protein Q9188_006402 [Gyalolechia gomerana]
MIPVIFEFQLTSLNRKLWTVLVHTDGGAFDYDSNVVDHHEVFLLLAYRPEVPMGAQERYALDLTHTQYGHQDETLMPWRTENARKVITEHFGQDGLNFRITAENFEAATTAAIRESSGWMKLWKEPDETVDQRKIDHLMEHLTMRLDNFIAAKAKDNFYTLWKSSTEKKLIEDAAKQILKEKHKLWGPDLRGPAFV